MNVDTGQVDAEVWPTVSVVVPTRQRPELLLRALVAIDGQRYPGQIETVVVFDQDTPVTPQIDPSEDRTIRIMLNDRTPGLAGARNTGILAARGTLIAHCDDDDEWLPMKLRLQVEAMRGAGAAGGVVASGVSIVYADRTIDRIPPHSQVTFDQLLRSRIQEIHPSSIIATRQAFLGSVGLVDEGLPGSYGEDYDWLLRAARESPIIVVPEPLVRAFWHRSSFFADRWGMIVDALSYLLVKFPEFERDSRGLGRIYGQIAFANAAAGRSLDARAWARRAIRLNWRERRSYLALAVSTGVVSADTVLRLAHRVGRGI